MPRQPRNGTFHPSATLFTNRIACKISFEHHQQWNQWWHFCELSYEAIHQTHVRTQRKTNHVANEMQLNFSESNRKEQLHSLSWTSQHCVAESHSPTTNSAHPSCYNRSMKRPLFHPVCKSIWRCIYRSICWYVCFILHLFICALERSGLYLFTCSSSIITCLLPFITCLRYSHVIQFHMLNIIICLPFITCYFIYLDYKIPAVIRRP